MPRSFVKLAYGAVVAAAVVLLTIGHPNAIVQTDSSSEASPALASGPTVYASAEMAAWAIPDIEELPRDTWGKTVRHGRDLITKTYALIGPEAADARKRFAGNNLACQNCHLDAGTRRFGLPFQGVYADFPNYRARSGAVGTIEDRIDDCMTRSMNGRAIPPNSPDMTAIVAYLKFLSDGRPVGQPTPGRGPGKMAMLTRAADPKNGQAIYALNCASCHGEDGAGQRTGQIGDGNGYIVPPLWGHDSFNIGAGMNRLIAAANFIHNNMPRGTSWQQPALSIADAWDVAAFILDRPHPDIAHLDHDYPVRAEKPVDTAYGPYADGFAPTQHKFGPFQPMQRRTVQSLGDREDSRAASSGKASRP